MLRVFHHSKNIGGKMTLVMYDYPRTSVYFSFLLQCFLIKYEKSHEIFYEKTLNPLKHPYSH